MMFSMTTSVQHRNGVHAVMIVHSTGYYVQEYNNINLKKKEIGSLCTVYRLATKL